MTRVVCAALALVAISTTINWYAPEASAKQSTTKAAKAADPSVKVYKAADRVMRATLQVISDVGQRQMAIETGDPRDWTPSDRQIDKDSKLWNAELARLGPLEPPKKAWLDADVSHLQRWVDLLNSEMGSATPTDDMKGALDALNKSFTNLQTLSAGPAYDNLKIASAALSVRDQAKKIAGMTRSK